jgi:hypothetical protein
MIAMMSVAGRYPSHSFFLWGDMAKERIPHSTFETDAHFWIFFTVFFITYWILG